MAPSRKGGVHGPPIKKTTHRLYSYTIYSETTGILESSNHTFGSPRSLSACPLWRQFQTLEFVPGLFRTWDGPGHGPWIPLGLVDARYLPAPWFSKKMRRRHWWVCLADWGMMDASRIAVVWTFLSPIVDGDIYIYIILYIIKFYKCI